MLADSLFIEVDLGSTSWAIIILIDLINMMVVVSVYLIILTAHSHNFLFEAVAHPVEEAGGVEGVGQVQVAFRYIVGQQDCHITVHEIQLTDQARLSAHVVKDLLR